MGYAQLFDHNKQQLAENIYGSELALFNLGNALSTIFEVYVTSLNRFEDMDVGNFHYIHNRHLEGVHTKFDVLIVWRYLNFFVHFSSGIATKTYMWLHDTYVLPWLEGHHLPDIGKSLFHNILPRLTNIVVLSEWHKAHIISKYEVHSPESIAKFHIIGNALQDDHIDMITRIQRTQQTDRQVDARVKNRFIWVSAHDRGLEMLLSRFPKIQEQLPDSELHIYRECSRELQDKFTHPFFKYHGYAANDEILKCMMRSQYWFYPTDFEETFCISALEAQACGCICIASPKGALQEIIADRGILINENVCTEAFWTEAITIFNSISTSATVCNNQDSMDWGKQQTWSKRSMDWLSLLGLKL